MVTVVLERKDRVRTKNQGESMPAEHKHENKASCPKCLSANVYGMSRVVGYYSIIENWNESKQAELKDRQKGLYKLGEAQATKIAEKHLEEPIRVTVKGCC